MNDVCTIVHLSHADLANDGQTIIQNIAHLIALNMQFCRNKAYKGYHDIKKSKQIPGTPYQNFDLFKV